MSLKLLFPGSVELAMLAFDAFSFRRHPRSLDMHTLHVTLHLVVARQQLSTDGAWNLLPTLQLLHLVHVFSPIASSHFFPCILRRLVTVPNVFAFCI